MLSIKHVHAGRDDLTSNSHPPGVSGVSVYTQVLKENKLIGTATLHAYLRVPGPILNTAASAMGSGLLCGARCSLLVLKRVRSRGAICLLQECDKVRNLGSRIIASASSRQSSEGKYVSLLPSLLAIGCK